MTRALVSAVVVATLFSQVLSGPACAKKYENSPECMKLCKDGTNWGIKAYNSPDGLFLGNMGLDPWGMVLSKSHMTLDEWIAQACGAAASSSAPSSTSSAKPKATIAGGAVNNEPKSSSSTEPKTTSTPPPPPKTTSKPPPPPKTTSTPPPPPKTTSTPPPAPSPKKEEPAPKPKVQGSAVSFGASSGTGSSDQQEWLDLHNNLRAKHGAGPVTWSDAAEAAAQKWADKCVFEHSGGSVGPFGENLAAGTGNYQISDAFKAWADEEPEYNPGNPKASHYTQVVWKGSNQIGCALAPSCSGIFPGSQARYYVCEYSAQGNVIGSFGENVQ